MMNNIDRLNQALSDLDVIDVEMINTATNLNVLLSGIDYSLFWGTTANGEPYIEWYNNKNHSISITFFEGVGELSRRWAQKQ